MSSLGKHRFTGLIRKTGPLEQRQSRLIWLIGNREEMTMKRSRVSYRDADVVETLEREATAYGRPKRIRAGVHLEGARPVGLAARA